MSLNLGDSYCDAIRRHGEESYPFECCGFLLGKVTGDRKQVLRVCRAENEGGAADRYRISPQAYLVTDQGARAAGLDILGFYHSHPDGEPRPSETDRREALPWCSYVIVSVKKGRAHELGSWVLRGDDSGFDREEPWPEELKTK